MNSMKVALITGEYPTDYLIALKYKMFEKRPPAGLGFLYAVLKSYDIEVDIYDRYCGDYNWPKDNFKSYDAVGIYCATSCLEDISYLVRTIECENLSVGGPHASLYPETFPDKVKRIIIGEGEHVIYDVVTNKVKDRIVKTNRLSSDDINQLPLFPFDYFYNKLDVKYDKGFPHDEGSLDVYALNTSRGCPYNCSFCNVKRIWGREIVHMSPTRMIDNIKHAINCGARGIYFREDNFTVSKKRVEEFCSLLIKENIDIRWGCETRVDTVDYNLMKIMKDSGCRQLFTGIEHLSPVMLKHYNKQITVEQVFLFMKNCTDLNIYTHASFIKNNPIETVEDKTIHSTNFKRLQQLYPLSSYNYVHFRNDRADERWLNGRCKI